MDRLMTNDSKKLFPPLILMAFGCAAFLSASGCDLGTYNQRFEEQLKKTDTSGAFSAPEEDKGASE